jgi:hypothetical protein
MQAFRPTFVSQASESLAKRGVSSRSFKERFHQCAQIESRSADKYCRITTSFHFFDGLARETSVVARGEVFYRLDNVYQVMGHAVALRFRDLGGGDVDTPVNLNGIQINDLAVACQGQPDAKVALTGGSGSYDYRNNLPCAGLASHRMMLSSGP